MSLFEKEPNSALAKFGEHRGALLQFLRAAYYSGKRSGALFNEDEAWDGIVDVAHWYPWLNVGSGLAPDERVRRFHAIADAAKRLRNSLEGLNAPSLVYALIEAWPEKSDGKNLFGIGMHDFDKAKVGVNMIEEAAQRAAKIIRKRPDAPRQSALPWSCIHLLADVYRQATGLEPGGGRGPFHQFVCEFLVAIEVDLSAHTVLDAVKGALRQAKADLR